MYIKDQDVRETVAELFMHILIEIEFSNYSKTKKTFEFCRKKFVNFLSNKNTMNKEKKSIYNKNLINNNFVVLAKAKRAGLQ